MTYQNPNNSFWARIFRLVGQFPLDLVAVVVFSLLTGAGLLVLGVESTVARAALGVPLLLFVPGYVLVAIVFPGEGQTVASKNYLPHVADDSLQANGIDGVERVALAFGMSVVLLPILALALAASPLPLETPQTVGVLVVTGCVGAVVAALRRFRLPVDERYRVPLGHWIGDFRASVFGTDRRLAGVINVVLVVSILLATATMGYALAAPQNGESYTTISLLTENESGELEANGYPTNFTAGQSEELTVGVENNEGTETTYTVVTVVQRVEPTDDGVKVLEQRELTRMQATVEPGETWRRQHEVAPEMLGENLRLQYFLYKGDVPETVSEDTAYRHVYLSINVDNE